MSADPIKWTIRGTTAEGTKQAAVDCANYLECEAELAEMKLEVVSGWVTREDLLDRAKAHRVDHARAVESANRPGRSPIGTVLSNERAAVFLVLAQECEIIATQAGEGQTLRRQLDQEQEIRREAHAQLDQAEVSDGPLDVRVASLVAQCAQYRKRLADQQSPFLQSGGPMGS